MPSSIFVRPLLLLPSTIAPLNVTDAPDPELKQAPPFKVMFPLNVTYRCGISVPTMTGSDYRILVVRQVVDTPVQPYLHLENLIPLYPSDPEQSWVRCLTRLIVAEVCWRSRPMWPKCVKRLPCSAEAKLPLSEAPGLCTGYSCYASSNWSTPEMLSFGRKPVLAKIQTLWKWKCLTLNKCSGRHVISAARTGVA